VGLSFHREIENYVHRIGRTGRCGKTGVATTFINKNTPESVLLDLKHLLIEAKQKVALPSPPPSPPGHHCLPTAALVFVTPAVPALTHGRTQAHEFGHALVGARTRTCVN